MVKKILILVLVTISFSIYAQEETHGSRTVKYIIDLNKLKYKSQSDGVESDLSKIKEVKEYKMDALNYKLYVSVFESENSKNTLGIDELKMILSNNKIEIQNYTQEFFVEGK